MDGWMDGWMDSSSVLASSVLASSVLRGKLKATICVRHE
jgi:hypothetical protein